MQIVSSSPQRPSDHVVAAPDSDPELVAAAVDRARAAGRDWAGTPAPQRSDALQELALAVEGAAADLAELVVREVGKPAGEAAGEVARTVAILRYYAQQALDPDGSTYPPADGRGLLYTRRRPLGVAGLITPWNFPAAIPMWKAAPALAFGNTVVLKPAEESTAVAIRLAEIADQVLPPDVFTVVTGGGRAGAALIELVDCVSFTGSVPVGRQVAAAAAGAGINAQCEMGGQNPSVVLPDADLPRAAATIAGAAMGYAGQKCTATSRVIVVGDETRGTQVAAAVVEAVRALTVGDPAQDGVSVGPVITEHARAAVVAAARRAEQAGATVLTGGTELDRDGWYVAPAVVTGLAEDAELAQHEVFGPICAVLVAPDADEALRIANGVRYGLVASVFTRDLDRALQFAERLDVGLARVNAPTSGVDFYAPFGGAKDSSYGPREQGKAARDFYTELRTITISPSG